MPNTLQAVLDAALQLSESDRMEIAERLLESLPEDELVNDPEFRKEIERRAADSAPGVPWKEIYAEG